MNERRQRMQALSRAEAVRRILDEAIATLGEAREVIDVLTEMLDEPEQQEPVAVDDNWWEYMLRDETGPTETEYHINFGKSWRFGPNEWEKVVPLYTNDWRYRW